MGQFLAFPAVTEMESRGRPLRKKCAGLDERHARCRDAHGIPDAGPGSVAADFFDYLDVPLAGLKPPSMKLPKLCKTPITDSCRPSRQVASRQKVCLLVCSPWEAGRAPFTMQKCLSFLFVFCSSCVCLGCRFAYECSWACSVVLVSSSVFLHLWLLAGCSC